MQTGIPAVWHALSARTCSALVSCSPMAALQSLLIANNSFSDSIDTLSTMLFAGTLDADNNHISGAAAGVADLPCRVSECRSASCTSGTAPCMHFKDMACGGLPMGADRMGDVCSGAGCRATTFLGRCPLPHLRALTTWTSASTQLLSEAQQRCSFWHLALCTCCGAHTCWACLLVPMHEHGQDRASCAALGVLFTL